MVVFVNVKNIKVYTLNGWIVLYVNYTSMKLFLEKKTKWENKLI